MQTLLDGLDFAHACPHDVVPSVAKFVRSDSVTREIVSRDIVYRPFSAQAFAPMTIEFCLSRAFRLLEVLTCILRVVVRVVVVVVVVIVIVV